MGSLVIIAPTFAAILVTCSILLWLVAVYLRRTQSLVLARMVIVPAIVVSVAATADMVNIHYSYMPRLNDVIGISTWPTASFETISAQQGVVESPPKHGTVVNISIKGKTSHFHGTSTFVYLPPQYLTDSTRRFPVIYMLHGSPGVPVDWFRAANASSIGDQLADAGTPALLVAPPVSKNWLDDSECVNRPTERIEQYVVDDVIPTVDATFHTDPSRDGRTVAGMSAGGFCALNIGLKHSDIFGAIVDMSGYAEPTHKGGMKGLFEGSEHTPQMTYDNTPSEYLTQLPKQRQRIWLDSGSADSRATHDAKYMATMLSEKNDVVQLNLRPGGHTYAVWRPAMAQSFPWSLNKTPD